MSRLEIPVLAVALSGLIACSGREREPQQGPRVSKQQAEVQETLRAAAGRDTAKVIQLLARNPALVNAKNDIGQTPLLEAVGAIHPKAELVKLLLEKGADVHAQNRRGETPLHIAAMRDDVRVVALLVARGAEVNARDNNGRTPLNSAVFANQPKTAQFLISKGAQVDVFDAAALGHIARLRKVLEHDSTLARSTDHSGQTALHWTAGRCQKEAAQLLLARGAERNALDRFQHTPSEVARAQGCPEVVELLSKK